MPKTKRPTAKLIKAYFINYRKLKEWTSQKHDRQLFSGKSFQILSKTDVKLEFPGKKEFLRLYSIVKKNRNFADI